MPVKKDSLLDPPLFLVITTWLMVCAAMGAVVVLVMYFTWSPFVVVPFALIPVGLTMIVLVVGLTMVALVQVRAVFYRKTFACSLMAIFSAVATVFSLGLGKSAASSLQYGLSSPTLVFVCGVAVVGLVAVIQAFLFLGWRDRLVLVIPTQPYCPKCRYDLTGTLMAARRSCPECGTDIPDEIIARYTGESTRTKDANHQN
ncbi:MAG: hypothetical protein K8S99_11005 [Planctomycetes bacterium]|nr:hypothetical protein [Planctomycetota bacterium]